MTRILVTGGAGYIGSKLVPQLLQEHYLVRVFDVSEALGEPLPFTSEASLEILPGNIRDISKLSTIVQGVKDVIHLAALVRGDARPGTPEAATMWEVNYQATCRLSELCQRNGVERFVFLSTCGSYGVADPDQPAKEEDPLVATSPYAESKIEAEKCVLSYANRQFHPVVLRMATVFGVSPRMSFEPLLNRLVYDAVLKKSLLVQGPHSWRPFIHIDDAVQAIALTLRSPLQKISRQVFNVGANSMNYQKTEIVHILSRYVTDLRVELREGDPRSYKVAFDKIARTLGFCPSWGLEEGIAEMVKMLGACSPPC